MEVKPYTIDKRIVLKSYEEELSEKYDPVLQGWWNYYGSFYRSEMQKIANYFNERLARWARRKFKRLARSRTRSREWVRKMMMVVPELFAHWRGSYG